MGVVFPVRFRVLILIAFSSIFARSFAAKRSAREVGSRWTIAAFSPFVPNAERLAVSTRLFAPDNVCLVGVHVRDLRRSIQPTDHVPSVYLPPVLPKNCPDGSALISGRFRTSSFRGRGESIRHAASADRLGQRRSDRYDRYAKAEEGGPGRRRADVFCHAESKRTSRFVQRLPCHTGRRETEERSCPLPIQGAFHPRRLQSRQRAGKNLRNHHLPGSRWKTTLEDFSESGNERTGAGKRFYWSAGCSPSWTCLRTHQLPIWSVGE